MPKHIHFHGKYMGDIKAIYHVLKDSGQYDVTCNFGYATITNEQPPNPDYVVTSHNDPKYTRAPNIHVQHGFGIAGRLLHATDEEYRMDYVQRYRAIGLYGKRQKEGHVARGYPEHRVMILGCPTSIELLEPYARVDRYNWFVDQGLDPDKKTVLYCPSWDHGSPRGLFALWFEDGHERIRVDEFCHHVTDTLGCNLIVRLHERHRYSQNWLATYADIFRHYGVNAHFLNDQPDITPFVKYSDQGITDYSNSISYFLTMDKPVIYISDGILPKWDGKAGGWPIEDRQISGPTVLQFEGLLDAIDDAHKLPERLSLQRMEALARNVDYIGEESKQAILREFARITC